MLSLSHRCLCLRLELRSFILESWINLYILQPCVRHVVIKEIRGRFSFRKRQCLHTGPLDTYEILTLNTMRANSIHLLPTLDRNFLCLYDFGSFLGQIDAEKSLIELDKNAIGINS